MKEDQTFLYIDEAQRLYPIDRVYPLRKEWEQFFQLHRHYGFCIILVTQNMSYINKGIRIQTEYEIRHRKVNNYGLFGLILTLLHIPLFCSLTFWQGTKEKIYSDFFLYKRKYGKLYNTFANFDTSYISGEHDAIDKSESKENEIIFPATREEALNTVFGSVDEEDLEEVDTGSADFDEENAESYDWDMYISEKELEEWKSAG